MGYKNVCFDCRKAFNMGTDFDNIKVSKCPECGQNMTLLSHRFRPPKKLDDKKWEAVKYLVSQGFRYQHIYQNVIINSNRTKSYENYVDYPETIKDAIDFVTKYRNQINNDF